MADMTLRRARQPTDLGIRSGAWEFRALNRNVLQEALLRRDTNDREQLGGLNWI